MDEENKVKPSTKMDVRGTEAKGRPRMRWMDNIKHDMNKCGLEGGDAQDWRRRRKMAQNPEMAEQFFAVTYTCPLSGLTG